MTEPVRVGLVGAGPWATWVHAPVLAGGAGTALAGVWARRPEAASALAAAHGVASFERFDELLEHCEAVAFAVPPDVQAELAAVAARAGKALLLEKPIAADLEHAQRLVDIVEEAGVPTQLVLSWRYSDAIRAFLAAVHAAQPIGGRGHFISGAFLGGPFATPWRLDHGPLLDVGPHVLDTLDAALGTIVDVRCHGEARRWVGILAEHESGVVSEVSLSAYVAIDPSRAGVEVYTHDGVIEVDAQAAVTDAAFARMAEEFARTARGEAHPLDVRRGLHLQTLIDTAFTDLTRRAR